MLASGNTFALEWYLEPAATVGLQRESNLLLTTAPHESVSGRWAGARAYFGLRTENWESKANLGVRSNRFDNEDFNSDEYTVKLFNSLKSERTKWGLDASSVRDSVLSGNIVDADTGLAGGQRERTTGTISPSWSYLLTTRTLLKITYQTNDVRYNDARSAGLVDYDQNIARLDLSYDLSARTRVFASMAESSFDVPDNRLTSRNRQVQVGASYAFSETLNGSLAVGSRRTDTDQVVTRCGIIFFGLCFFPEDVTVSASDTGSTLNATLQKQFERTRVEFNASRALSPSGAGAQVDADSISLLIEREIRSNRLWASFSGDALRLRTIVGDPTGIDRDYYRLEPRLRYQWSENVEIATYYRYTRRRYESLPEAAENNAVYLTVTYRSPRMSRSR